MKKILRYTLLLLILPAATSLFAQPCDCLTTGNCPVPIQDNGTFQGTLDVTVDGPNDLSQCPLQQVCFQITHTWVGDLAITLTSPGGLNYIVMGDDNNGTGGCGTDEDNIDVCITTGTGNPLTNNTAYMCNSGGCYSGFCCLTGIWTMPCNGVNDPITFAQQAPNCDLNDFNLPGQPANGTWTLTVNDICAQDIGFLENFSLVFACGTVSCIVCEADGGVLNAPDVTGCFGDPSLNLSLNPTYSGPPPNPGEYGYAYVISQNGIITSVNPTPDMSFQPAGVYEVCGFSYALVALGDLQSLVGMNLATAQTQFSSATAPFCGDFSDDCLTVTIGPPIPPTFFDTTVCLGDCIDFAGSLICNSGPVTLTSWLGCDSVINVVLVPIPPIFTDTTVTVCQGECITVNGQLYCPPAPAVYTLPNWQGCDSTVTLIFDEILTTAIILPQIPPPLSCSNPSITLDGLSSIPGLGPNVTYAWTGPNFTSTSPVVSVTESGIYTLTIINSEVNPPCTSSASVTIIGNQNEPELQLNSPPPSICEGDVFDLSTLVIVDLNNTNPTITFHSATPASLSNQLPGTLVSPATTTTYYALGTAGICTDEIPITVTVNPIPTADFTVTSPICLDSTATVTYTGNASPNATFNWNFGGGTAIPGAGPGPHTVSWATGGTKTITLVVTENGCSSQSVSQTVEVNSQIPAPLVNCSPTTSTIVFTWIDVPGATGYNVTVTTGQTGSMTGSTTYEVTGLGPGEQVTILVEAISGNACPGSSTSLTCTAQDCPPVTVTIDPVADFCLDGTAVPVVLSASQSGGAGGGTFVFSGPGVDPATGVFDPANANPGPNTINVTYSEGTCQYNASIVINVFPQPSATFTVTSPICVSDNSTVNYTGNASNNATFTWDFDGGTATPGAGPGPHAVTWAAGGTYTVTLTVEEDGCASQMTTQTVTVENELPDPEINCVTTTSTVEFFWDQIPGAGGYDVTVIGGGTGTATSDTSILFTGLNPGDAVTIQVTALNPGACGNSSAQETCIAQDCPPVVIGIEPVGGICLDSSALPFDLMATVSGSAGGGTLTWSGNGITDPANGTFDPNSAAIGANTVTATYEEGNCTFTEDIIINVWQIPVAGFTVETPVCENEPSTVTFTGNVQAGLTYDWDFGGGTATPGTGQGPHNVTWTTAGSQTVTLTLTNANGCVSEVFSETVEVEAALVAPAITCNTTTTSIEFTWPDVPGATNYEVAILSGPAGTQISQNAYLVDGLSPGDQVTISLLISNDGPCPLITIDETCTALDCPPITVEVQPVNPLCIGAASPLTLVANVTGSAGTGMGAWSGNGITDPAGGVFDAGVAGIGEHVVTYIFEEENCIYEDSDTIVVFSEPSADFTATANICVADAATATYAGNAGSGANFTWNFDGGTATPGAGPGPHQITWPAEGNYQISLTVEQDGCASDVFTQNVQVDAELETPDIDCNTTTESVEFTWNTVNGATDYEVEILAGQTGSQTSQTSYLVDGLTPGDAVTLQLTVSGPTACPPVVVEETCVAQDCPIIEIDVEPVPAICLGAAVPTQLTANVSGSASTGTGVWSGPGVIDAVNGIFDPIAAGVGQHVVTYEFEEDNCSFDGSTTIDVFADPTADFTATSVICVADAATVTYAGNAGTGANFTWDFGSGTATPGTGPGPHQVTWPSEGNYQISLTVGQNGCVSSTFTQDVQVDAELELPVIDCSATTESVEFTWNTVSGATDYEVEILAGQTGTQTSQTSYLVDGLTPGDAVTLQLTISGQTACPPVVVEATCVAQECPPVEIEITPVAPICLTAFAELVNLEATLTGSSGGTETWSGTGIVDPATGVFDPAAAGLGNHLITFTYSEANCVFDKTLQIEVAPPPVADAGADATLTCMEGETEAELGGDANSAGPDIAYLWSAAGGPFPGDSTALHPVVSAPGTYTLTVVNTALGCETTDEVVVDASQEIPVPEISITPVTCFGDEDGAISVLAVSGGLEPYLFSLNGSPFSSASTFLPLGAGEYELTVVDAAGCENTVTLDILQPQEVNVELLVFIEGDNVIRLGDSVQLEALLSIPLDSLDLLDWSPDSLLSCDGCPDPVAYPIQTTTFSVTVESNGCPDSDQATIFVKKDRPVFVPNAFSPNDDGVNDLFMIFSGPQVSKVKSFLVFDRWGETVFEYYNFQPNDPAFGWNGMYRNEKLNPGVFTWFAEIEFVDGATEIFEGDVTLMR